MLTPGVQNLARLGGDREIAGGDELAAGGGGDALHGGDHRLGAGDDRLHHGGAARHRLGVEGAAAVGVGAVRGQLLQIVAGAERRPVGGEHDGRHGAVGAEPREAGVQPVDHLQRQAVARFGTVEGDERHARLRPVDEKQRVGADLVLGGDYRAVLHQLLSSPL